MYIHIYYVHLSLYSAHYRFLANEQTDRAWAARIAYPSTLRHSFTILPMHPVAPAAAGVILSRPVVRSQSTCCIAKFLPPRIILSTSKKAASMTGYQIALSRTTCVGILLLVGKMHFLWTNDKTIDKTIKQFETIVNYISRTKATREKKKTIGRKVFISSG